VREEVDLAWQARGGLVERLLGGGIEERDGGAGELEAVREVGGQLLAGERRDVIADDDSLGQRLVDGHGETSTQFGLPEEQQAEAVHPAYHKPELLATAPNQLWSWDITKLLGPAKWTYFYLYVILDVVSRYVVGWMIAHREGAELAEAFIGETIAKHAIAPGQLTLHADRGRVMRSKPVAFLLADLGVTKTHSRPYVSDDNPYSESQFRTLKYRPEFPTVSGPSTTLAPSVTSSSRGTTTTIATQARQRNRPHSGAVPNRARDHCQGQQPLPWVCGGRQGAEAPFTRR
jgi:transposase InsO family protein